MNSERLKELLVEASGNTINKSDIYDNTNIIDDLGFDSVMYLKALIAIDDEFGVELDDEDIDDISVFSALLSRIENKQ